MGIITVSTGNLAGVSGMKVQGSSRVYTVIRSGDASPVRVVTTDRQGP
ncbi:MAG: hypothetical protein WC379_12330 [Methanoregula sp.]